MNSNTQMKEPREIYKETEANVDKMIVILNARVGYISDPYERVIRILYALSMIRLTLGVSYIDNLAVTACILGRLMDKKKEEAFAE